MLPLDTFDRPPYLASDLAAARAGDRAALDRLTEACRPYLLRIANAELDSGLRPKCGASDLVQNALLEGQKDFARFVGESEDDLLKWLRRILRNNLIDEARKYLAAAGRDVRRERTLDDDHGGTIREGLPARHATPLEALVGFEKRAALEAGLDRLPDEFRRAIHLRHVEEMTFAQIGEALGKSEEAARKVWFRALARLRQELEAYDEFRSSVG